MNKSGGKSSCGCKKEQKISEEAVRKATHKQVHSSERGKETENSLVSEVIAVQSYIFRGA